MKKNTAVFGVSTLVIAIFLISMIPTTSANTPSNVEVITVFDHEISNGNHPAFTTITIPDKPIESCIMTIEGFCDPDDHTPRAIHFVLDPPLPVHGGDGRGGWIGVECVGYFQFVGDVIITGGQTRTWTFDMSDCMFANTTPPDYGFYYTTFIPQDENDIVGYFSPGEHTVEAYISSLDSHSGEEVETWISISLEFEFKPISATVDFDPDTLNLKSSGKWVTTYIELEEGYNVNDIDVSTILLEGVIAAEVHSTDIGDYDNDGIPDLMVKFDRQALIDYLDGQTGEITLTIAGELSDGTTFEGSATITVKMPGKSK